ncbi:MAG: hypothetical protein H6619_01990 [Deltaproteobacteria bacterium]|nr:hypothetical protein [Deltaproteobacteria bacterium]
MDGELVGASSPVSPERFLPAGLLQPDYRWEIVDPEECARLLPTAHQALHLFRFQDTANGFSMSIATVAEPNSGKYSLGGLRIVPEADMRSRGFSADKVALGLADGMEQKVFYSRLVPFEGLRISESLRRGEIVGGKVVVCPNREGWVGQANDREFLDFVIKGLQTFEAEYGVTLVTGQDVGHGVLHSREGDDGIVTSLRYLNERFVGSRNTDTSFATAHGNIAVLSGLRDAFEIPIHQLRLGLCGFGAVGRRLIDGFRWKGVDVTGLHLAEYDEAKFPDARTSLEDPDGIRVHPYSDRGIVAGEEIDGFVVNALRGSLTQDVVRALCANTNVRFVTGCENLPFPLEFADQGERELMQSGTLWIPTEFTGMMGFITAVESVHAERLGDPFHVTDMKAPAKLLRPYVAELARRYIESVVAGSPVSRFNKLLSTH